MGQLPPDHLFFLQNLNFIITKYLKEEVECDLSICMDEHSSWGLSKTGDIKIINVSRSKGNDVTTPDEEVPYQPTSITKLLLLPTFDNSSSSITQDKEICHVIKS